MNPFPQQGFIASHPQQGHAAPPPLQSSHSHYQIFMMNSDGVNTSDINLQTWSLKYDKPLALSVVKPKTKESFEPIMTPNGYLHIPSLKMEVIQKIREGPLHDNATSNRAAHTYSIAHDLAQYPTTMSAIEVL